MPEKCRRCSSHPIRPLRRGKGIIKVYGFCVSSVILSPVFRTQQPPVPLTHIRAVVMLWNKPQRFCV